MQRSAVQSCIRHIRTKALAYVVNALVAGCILLLAVPAAQGQASGRAQTNAKPVPEAKPRWQDLKPAQRQTLKPLEREWQSIDSERKQKWLAIAEKYPSMLPQEQSRVQDRMADWAKLSPAERGITRQQFEAAKRVAPQDRPAQWEAYQALAPEQKRKLVDRAAGPVPAGPVRQLGHPPAARADGKTERAQGKSNIVPNPAFSARPTPINSTAVQAQPGATTTSVARRASPPAHQQPGLPKIAASPGFVDKATLLPRRGPQGAAVRSSSASEPIRQP